MRTPLKGVLTSLRTIEDRLVKVLSLLKMHGKFGGNRSGRRCKGLFSALANLAMPVRAFHRGDTQIGRLLVQCVTKAIACGEHRLRPVLCSGPLNEPLAADEPLTDLFRLQYRSSRRRTHD